MFQPPWKPVGQRSYKTYYVHNNPKPMGLSKSSAKGKVQSNTGIPQETIEKSNK